MGERLLCKQEVIGSIPFSSTRLRPRMIPYPIGRTFEERLAIYSQPPRFIVGGWISRGPWVPEEPLFVIVKKFLTEISTVRPMPSRVRWIVELSA